MAIRDKGTERLLNRIARAENREMARRRRQLSAGLSKALAHLRVDEIDEIEDTLARAIGRSVIRGRR